MFDQTQLARGARVALLGANAVRSLGIEAQATELPTALYIAGSRFVVEGIVKGLSGMTSCVPPREPDLGDGWRDPRSLLGPGRGNGRSRSQGLGADRAVLGAGMRAA